MSKGKFQKRKAPIKVPAWLIVGALVAAALLLVFLCFAVSQQDDGVPSGEHGEQTTNPSAESTGTEDEVTAGETGSNQGEDPTTNIGEDPTTNSGEDPTSNSGEDPTTSSGEDPTTSSDEDPTTNSGQGPAGETTDPGQQEVVTQPTIDLVQRVEADYERWLAAAMVVCVSMEHTDFGIEGIYAASETTIAEKHSSEGVYVIFTVGGVRKAVHSVALSAERKAAGTKDISTEALGFATFDLVDPGSVNTNSMTKIEIEELEELIAQSLLVSIYIH